MQICTDQSDRIEHNLSTPRTPATRLYHTFLILVDSHSYGVLHNVTCTISVISGERGTISTMNTMNRDAQFSIFVLQMGIGGEEKHVD
jgi:hypothetical protein